MARNKKKAELEAAERAARAAYEFALSQVEGQTLPDIDEDTDTNFAFELYGHAWDMKDALSAWIDAADALLEVKYPAHEAA